MKKQLIFSVFVSKTKIKKRIMILFSVFQFYGQMNNGKNR